MSDNYGISERIIKWYMGRESVMAGKVTPKQRHLSEVVHEIELQADCPG